MPGRRLEDRIHELCGQATDKDWRRILSELRMAIQEHTMRVSNRAAAAVVGGMPHIMRERRERRLVPSDWIPNDFRDLDDRSIS